MTHETVRRSMVWEQIFKDLPIQTLCFEEVSSTMEIAREHRELSQSDFPLAIIASRQSSGKGRMGRVWHTAADGIAVTYVFRFSGKAEQLAGLSLVVGIAVAEYLEKLGATIMLKWPNDLLDRVGRKLGGILIEVSPSSGENFVSIGIGLNLKERPELDQPTASLEELLTGSKDRNEILRGLHSKILSYWNEFVIHGFERFRKLWMERSIHSDRMLEIDTGKEIFQGKFLGVGARGELELSTTKGVKQFYNVERVRDVTCI